MSGDRFDPTALSNDTDKTLAEELNAMMEVAQRAKESADRLNRFHITDQVEALESLIVTQYVGSMAALTLKDYRDSGDDFRTVIQRSAMRALRMMIHRTTAGRPMTPQMVEAANRYQQSMMCNLPPFMINSHDLHRL